jgi:hypothetical protein
MTNTDALGPTTCPTCLRDINAVNGCEPNHAHDYGLEPDWNDAAIPERCRDCGAGIGRAHHVPGCVVARCKRCGEQATFCRHQP